MKKILTLMAAGVLACIGIPVHADTACIAPYPSDPSYPTKIIAFDDCQTDNYNIQQCSTVSSVSTTGTWNKDYHTCEISCKPGYYRMTNAAGVSCGGSGPEPVVTPPPAPVAPVTTTTVVTAPAPIMAPTVKPTPQPSAKKEPVIVAPAVNVVASVTPSVTASPIVPVLHQKSWWEQITGFFKSFF